jgi:hypothetical protein
MFSRFEEHRSAVIIIAEAICAVPWKIERRFRHSGLVGACVMLHGTIGVGSVPFVGDRAA